MEGILLSDFSQDKELAFLETYFKTLANFYYDVSKEIIDREKERLSLSGKNSLWCQLIAVLPHLTVAEQSYTSFQFLRQNFSQKLFRRDTLKQTYENIYSITKKLEDVCAKSTDVRMTAAQSPSNVSRPGSVADAEVGKLESKLRPLLFELAQFILSRIKMIEFYESVNSYGQSKIINFGQLHSSLAKIIEELQGNYSNAALSKLLHSSKMECDIVCHLLSCQLEMQQWSYMSSLHHLHEAATQLKSWAANMESEGTSLSHKSPSVTAHQSKSPVLYDWLSKFHLMLLSKFTFYFWDTLRKQASPNDLAASLTKPSAEIVNKILAFHKKTGCLNISLVYDVSDIEDTFKGEGYHFPRANVEPPRGLDIYPAVFSYPNGRPDKCWPMIVSIISDYHHDLNSCEKIVCIFDEKLICTYFLMTVEARITFVVIFEAKKSERDTSIVNFINDMCSRLRLSNINRPMTAK